MESTFIPTNYCFLRGRAEKRPYQKIQFFLLMTKAARMAPVTMNPPSSKDILQCQLSSWYDIFRHLPSEHFERTNVTIKTIILDLPDTFRDYLISDGVRLPEGATKVSSCTPTDDYHASWSDDDDDDDDEGEPEESPATSDNVSFPQLNHQIQMAIEALGGEVMPKLNWSSPKDATWINLGSLKCKYPGDVYLLLKSSDFVMHDVMYALDRVCNVDNRTSSSSSQPKLQLSLRKWCTLYPNMEFRCFVFQNQLLAISQRNHSQHFPHLTSDRMLLRSLIIEFFDDVVQSRFPSKNYTFDVYIDKKERLWLLDFNVWGSQTDALCFEWDELLLLSEQPIEDNGDVPNLDNAHPELRIVETENEIHHDPLASYRAPIDTIEVAGMIGGDASKFEDFMKMCHLPPDETEECDVKL